ncbi:MAG: hypothetical protein GYA12_08960 [Chloroflexi bacterium]|nr:hypothetical protein [Chloroflexota bacterium]
MIINDEDQIPPDNPLQPAAEEPPSQPVQQSKRKIRLGLIMTGIGFALFILGARPSVYGLDRSQVIGFVQVSVFLFGIAIICVGAFLVMQALRQGKPYSLLFQIGMRFVQTGYVIALFTGLADVLGLGSHPLPRPFFGPLQSVGVQIGEFVIGLGILMMFPFDRIITRRTQPESDNSANNSHPEYQ